MGKSRYRLWAILFVVALLFIWGNSILPSRLSMAVSEAVGDWLRAVFSGGEAEEDGGWLTQFFLRKTAHFTEFLILGCLASALLSVFLLPLGQKILILLPIGLGVPLLDETIQLFNDRTSSVRDVWIDFAGFAVGCLICLGISEWQRYRRRKKMFACAERQKHREVSQVDAPGDAK